MTSAPLGRIEPRESVSTGDVGAGLPHRQQVLRQTQALMGVVLLSATAATYFWNAAWLVVPAIIGLGLVFAGLSGLCPMASLIAAMPWNRASVDRSGCCGGRGV